jgi:hypothetical protein
MKFLENEFRKETLSKNITGLKLTNNKNLFLMRIDYFNKYCEFFKSNIESFIEKFDNIRLTETEYVKRWNELIADLNKPVI